MIIDELLKGEQDCTEIFKSVEASDMDPMTNPDAVAHTCQALE